jgi:bacitracin synthase 1
MSNANNLCDVLEHASRNSTGIVFIKGHDSEKFLSYKKLYNTAKGILYNMKKHGITRNNEVILQIEDNESFICVFWACVLGGIIPIPLHVAVNEEQQNQLINIFTVLKNPKLITDVNSETITCVEKDCADKGKIGDFSNLIIGNTIYIKDIINVTDYDEVIEPLPEDIAYIQFSSGSTGNPKGIMISHENVISNTKAILKRVKCNKQDSILNWLPITHSFSLVVGHIASMYAEINQYLMPTMLFLQNPTLWMEKADQYKNTMLLSPNFGFNHFLAFTNQEISYNWDLSSIKIIATGGEPIDVAICNNFTNYLSKYGLDKNTIWPSYGMTESTVAITAPMLGDHFRFFQLERESVGYGNKISEISDNTAKNIMNVVSVGYPYDECEVRICGQNNEIFEEKYVGSIQIKGKNVTKGYYNDEAKNREAFTEDGWFKTGDIGFLFENQLVVTGREKDIIFINGQNYYPMDIERIAKDTIGLAFNEVAACGIFNKEKQKEEVAIFVLTKENIETFASKAIAIKKHVNNCTGLEVSNIIPVVAFPKASSGKIQRYKLMEQFLNGDFDDSIQALSKVSLSNFSRKIKKPKNATEESLVLIWSQILKNNNIGVNQSFFELGGDSLKAALVLHRINKTFHIDISLRDVFKHITIESLSEYISGVESDTYKDIQKAEERKYYPLSSAQRRLYALNELHKEGIAYNITQVFIVEEDLDIERVKETFDILISRHEALRTSFELQEGLIVQRIHDNVEGNFTYMEAEEKNIEQIIDQFIIPFELDKAPLFRTGVVKTNQQNYYIILDIHHIISDGTSIVILMKEFAEIYNNEKLPEHKLNYKDYAVWQETNKNSEKINKQKEYWLKEFSNPLPLLNLPTDYKRPSKQQFEGNSVSFTINEELTSHLKYVAKNTNTTLYMVLLSAFNLFIHKYSNQEEVIIGTVTSGRNFDSLHDVVGMFVNTLAIRSRLYEEESFADYLLGIKEKCLEGIDNSDYQFDQLIEDLHMNRDLSRNPLFDVMFVMENMEIPTNDEEHIRFKIYDYKPKGTKLDLTLKVQEREGEIICLFQYSTALFKEGTIHRFIQYYLEVLNEITDSSDKKISSIGILPYKERETILNTFNKTNVTYNKDLTIFEMFERQVDKTPNNIAVVCGKEKLTYDELNQKANALARTLRQDGVNSDTIVGLFVERSIYMIIGILAVMKAGGAYMPIDSEYPSDRITYMLENSDASSLITQKHMKNRVDFSGKIYAIDDTYSYMEESGDLEPISTVNNIAYVIYTSGSTGKPKGVKVEHRSLVNYITWFSKKADLKEKDKTILLSSFAFDLSYTSLYSSLLSGGELHIVSKEDYTDPEKLLHYINSNEITYIKATPSLFSMLVNTYSFNKSDICKSIRLIVLGGEPINVTLVEKYNQLYPDAQIMNHYGPTECTIGCIATLIDLNNLNEYKRCPVIGMPIDNAKVFILDNKLEPVAIGQTGELYIGGSCLARGYMNLKDLDKERFLKNPFTRNNNDRIYKTGDLGRYLEDGSIEFLGRIDNQVKVRGYRIELGEIENSILSYPGVDKACVIDIEDSYGNKEICAYIVTSKELTTYNLRKYLLNKLPTYMIPSYFVTVDEIPITSNGKVNRKALPIPNKEHLDTIEYVEPRTDTEKRLVTVWREVLGVDKIGIDNNFFEIGGHSLKATILMSKIQKEFNVLLSMKDIFDNPTIRELSSCMNSKNQSDFCMIKKVEKQPYYPVASSQKRIFTLSQIDPNSTNYNMPAAYIMKGNLDLGRLQDSLSELINRHEVFRTSFHIVNGDILQQVHDHVDVEVCVEESKETMEQIIKEFVKPFSLNTLPLFRFKLLKVKQEEHVLLMDMHHIIFDGVSIGIFVRELNALYNGNSLQELKLQYKDYAVWQRDLLNSDTINRQEQYWLNAYKSEWSNLTLPLDYERPTIQSFEGACIKFEIDTTMTKLLRDLNKNTGTTLFMVLFGAYSILLSKYSTQEDIIVGTAEAGRHHADLENLIGMFINTLPVRTYPCGNKTLLQYVNEVKDTCFEVFNNSDYQFDTLLEKLNIKREMGRNPLFDTMFILENVESSAIDMNGLTFETYEINNTISKFDLMLVGEEIEDRIQFQFKYCTKLFDIKTIERLKDSYIKILNALIHNQYQRICEINYIDEKEENKILQSFNNTNTYYPQDKTIAQLFEQQVLSKPDKTAVVFKENRLSYLELDHRANSVAHMLMEKGIGNDSIVGIMVKRSVNMIAGIIGILKAGAAYMPISEEYPMNRIQYMMEDSKATLLLTESALRDQVSYVNHVVCIDNEALYKNYSQERVENTQSSRDLAYVIYTSGTTGKPKGVMIENRSVVNLIYSLYDKVYQRYDGALKIALIAPYIFDASVKQIFASLLLGHTLHIIPEEARVDGEVLLDYYIENSIDISDGTPIHLSILSNCSREQLNVIPVRCFLIGGEALHNGIVANFLDKCNHVNKTLDIVNVYGPTECCVDATSYIINQQNINEDIVIGKPLNNVNLYVLDKYKQILPIGIPGELYIAGDGVARGYMNNQELTKSAFMEDCFHEGRRMYRTGDLVKWTEDGNIKYLDRIDHQVKIRGFRIELGEIEKQLLRHYEINEAVVLARSCKENQCTGSLASLDTGIFQSNTKENDFDSKYLCAYITASSKISIDELRRFLLQELPEYMIPSYFVQMDQLPITTNGKVDRKLLPEPDLTSTELEVPIELPEDETQEILVKVWREVLGIQQIGINNNYYSLGGDSIKAIQISSKLRDYNLKVAIRDLLQHQTIKELSNYVTSTVIQTSQEMVTGQVKLTPIQRAFFEHHYTVENHYNQSIMLYSKKGFDEKFVEKAFKKITKHHDALRMTFKKEGNDVIQMNENDDSQVFQYLIYYVDVEDYESYIEEKANEIQRNIDLENGPLVNLGLFKTYDGDHLLIVIHHLVIDGVSWRILLQDFELAYKQLEKGQEIVLASKTDSYMEWANMIYRYAKSPELMEQFSYWDNIETQSILPLEKDKNLSGERKLNDCETIRVILDEEYTDKLLRETNTAYNTEINDILLTALARTVRNWTDNGKILIDLEGHGREDISENLDITRTIGWFTAKYPVLFHLEDSCDLSNEIKIVKETLRHVPQKGIGYSILRYITLPMRNNSECFLLEPEICFNYLGQFDNDITSDVFTTSSIGSGDNISKENTTPYSLSVGGMIVNNQLIIKFTYNTKEFYKETIDTLSSNYIMNLQEIIEHCSSKQEQEYTPSDFDDDNLSFIELDNLNEMLQEIEI